MFKKPLQHICDESRKYNAMVLFGNFGNYIFKIDESEQGPSYSEEARDNCRCPYCCKTRKEIEDEDA